MQLRFGQTTISVPKSLVRKCFLDPADRKEAGAVITRIIFPSEVADRLRQHLGVIPNLSVTNSQITKDRLEIKHNNRISKVGERKSTMHILNFLIKQGIAPNQLHVTTDAPTVALDFEEAPFPQGLPVIQCRAGKR